MCITNSVLPHLSVVEMSTLEGYDILIQRINRGNGMPEIDPAMAAVPQEIISWHAFAKKLHTLKQSSSEMPLNFFALWHG